MDRNQVHAVTPYLTVPETCAALRVSKRTLDRYVAAGKLRAVRLPSGHRRFAEADVEALLAQDADWSPAS